MPGDTNRQITLGSRPVNYPRESDFVLVESPVPEPGEGEVLIQSLWLSLDPLYARPDAGRPRLRHADGAWPGHRRRKWWGASCVPGLRPFRWAKSSKGPWAGRSTPYPTGATCAALTLDLGPLPTALGVLGMPGMTAYFGFLEVGQPRVGDTVVVSAASGAVGQVVGQISKIMGCRTIGVAGSPAKIDYIVNELGFDAGINYKTENVSDALRRGLPPWA